MFKNVKAFSGFSVDDLQKAKTFYSDVLGIEVKDNPMGLIELHIHGGIPILVYPKPNHQPATYTVLNFPVDNIDEAVEYLISRGVTMEQYAGQLQTNDKGIMRDNEHAIAWFKDPAGNILSVIESGN